MRECVVPDGNLSQRCIGSSQPYEVGAGESGSAKQPTAVASRRAAIAFPEDAAAAVKGEVEADLEPAVGDLAIDLVLAFDPHAAIQPAAAVTNYGAGAASAGRAMTDIDAVRFSRCDRSQRSAVTFRDPLHLVLPEVPLRRLPILALAKGSVERLILRGRGAECDRRDQPATWPAASRH